MGGQSDEAKFLDLYDRYRRDVHAYCARRATSEAQDLVAEVFLVAWRRLDQIPEGRDALYWLYGVAFRIVSRQWRSARRRGRAVERLRNLADVDLGVSSDAVVVQRFEYRLVLEAASRLRTIDQEILRLTLWEELSHKEVSEVLGVDVDAVKQRAHRARRRLGDEYRRLMRDQTENRAIGREVRK